MKHEWTFVLALIAFCGTVSFAEARPPTVMNSPGYDARLQESRKALDNPPRAATSTNAPAAAPKRSNKKHAN